MPANPHPFSPFQSSWFTLIKTIWWLLVAVIPLGISRLGNLYASQIGCPSQGDCYHPGAEHLMSFDALLLVTAILLWPICLWHLGRSLWQTVHRNQVG